MHGCCLLLFVCACKAQVQPEIHTVDQLFDQTIRNYLSFSVPVVSVEALADRLQDTNLVVLDTRSRAEFDLSHIPGSIFGGYGTFDVGALELAKDAEIVVYCSIGYRSEKIGEKLIKKGFSNVHNLYGSIFEWVNQGHPVVDSSGTVRKIHTYNRKWSQYVKDPDVEKQW